MVWPETEGVGRWRISIRHPREMHRVDAGGPRPRASSRRMRCKAANARRETSMRCDGDGRPGARARASGPGRISIRVRGVNEGWKAWIRVFYQRERWGDPPRVSCRPRAAPRARGTFRTHRPSGARADATGARRPQSHATIREAVELSDAVVGRSEALFFRSLPLRPPDAIFSFSVSAQARARAAPAGTAR